MALDEYLNISIHALLAESDKELFLVAFKGCISIHALLAESDNARPETRRHDVISIHALLAESDLNAHLYYHSRGLFLSTLSLRRATVSR